MTFLWLFLVPGCGEAAADDHVEDGCDREDDEDHQRGLAKLHQQVHVILVTCRTILHILTPDPAAFTFWFFHYYENGSFELFDLLHQIITDLQLYLEVSIACYQHIFTILHHLSKQKRHWASTILCHLCTSRRLPAVAGAGCCCCWCRSCWRSRGAGPGAPRSWRRAPGSRTSPGCILAPGLLTIDPVCAWAVVEVWLGMQMWHTG